MWCSRRFHASYLGMGYVYRFWRGTVDDKDPTPLEGFNKVFVHEQMGDGGGFGWYREWRLLLSRKVW